MTGAGGVGAMRLITKAQDIESLLQREKVARISETDEVLCKIHARTYSCPKQPTLPYIPFVHHQDIARLNLLLIRRLRRHLLPQEKA